MTSDMCESTIDMTLFVLFVLIAVVRNVRVGKICHSLEMTCQQLQVPVNRTREQRADETSLNDILSNAA